MNRKPCKFAKLDIFLRINLESKISIYVFLCCAVAEEANEALHGKKVQSKIGFKEATM